MGGGKAPLAFLNKKPWHPARFQNQEEVWKREQAAIAEARKAEELRKQLEEERKRNELAEIAQAAGHIKRGDRLDWMYQGGLAAKEDAEKRADEHLLGKAATLHDMNKGMSKEDISKCEMASNLPSFTMEATPASQNEAWARLNNDPLLMIKKRQQDQLKSIRENPVKMQQIIREVQENKEKKKKKKGKKDKKSKRSHGGGDNSESSGGEGPSGAHGRISSLPGSDSRGVMHPRHAEGRHDSRSRSRSPARHKLAEKGHQINYRRSRSRSPIHLPRERHSHRSEGPRATRSRSPSQHSHHKFDRLHEDKRADAKDRGGERSRPDAFVPARSHKDDGQHGPSTDSRYGLTLSRVAPDQVLQYGTSQRAAETRARLDEAACRQEEERRKASQRFQRKVYQTGQMTEEERLSRLKEMSSNASEHEQQRADRLRRAKEAEAVTEGKVVTNVGGVGGREGDAFMKAASRDIYGALSTSAGTLEARVSSRKHFNAR